MIALIVHGGAWPIPDESVQAVRAGCEAALDYGYAMLIEGRSAFDAVEAAARILEDNPLFDAGTGSHPTHVGDVEMDAIIVDGKTFRFGSVAAIRNVRNPISVAREVMEQSPHAMMVGEGATNFARDCGFEYVPDAELSSGKTAADKRGTIGAVALDREGNLAVATSTGGMRGQLKGRVGDSPLIGCGAYCDNAIGGVSSTGWGESLMRVTMARTTVEYMRYSDPPTAAHRAVLNLARRTNGQGGVICIDPRGQLGFAHSTPRMAAAGIGADGVRVVLP